MPNEILKTDQEVFIYVREHLLNQNEKSFYYRGTCGYRGVSKEALTSTWMMLFDTEAPDMKDWPEVNTLSYRDAFRVEAAEAITPKNLSCAIGCLISDAYYRENLENSSIENHLVIEAVQKSAPEWSIEDSSLRMLSRLQHIHDKIDVDNWVEYLDNFDFYPDGRFKTSNKNRLINN